MSPTMLQEPSIRLMVIGYGCNDEHTNRTIMAAADAGSLRVFLIDPNGFDVLDRGSPPSSGRPALTVRLARRERNHQGLLRVLAAGMEVAMADAARVFPHVSSPLAASTEINDLLDALDIVRNALEQSIDDNFVTGQQMAALALADRIKRRYRADDRAKRGTADRSASGVSVAHEIDYWAATVGVSRGQLLRTRHKVGATPDNMRPERARISEKA